MLPGRETCRKKRVEGRKDNRTRIGKGRGEGLLQIIAQTLYKSKDPLVNTGYP